MIDWLIGNGPLIAFLTLAFVAFVASYFKFKSWRAHKNRPEQMSLLAEKLGGSFRKSDSEFTAMIEKDLGSAQIADFHPAEETEFGINLFEALNIVSIEGQTMYHLFDYSMHRHGKDSEGIVQRITTSKTFLYVRCSDTKLPRFFVKPKSFGDKLKRLLGSGEVKLDDSAKPLVDFASAFQLVGDDHLKLQDVFTNEVAETFMLRKDMCCECWDHHLLFTVDQMVGQRSFSLNKPGVGEWLGIYNAQEIIDFHRTALKLAETLIASSSDPAKKK